MKKLNQYVQENGYGVLESAGLSVHTIQKMMNGRYESEPKELTRKAISRATGIPENELFPLLTEDGDGNTAA